MTPVARCLDRLSVASVRDDSAVVLLVDEALAELEAAFSLPGESIAALEAVLREMRDRPGSRSRAFSRLLAAMIDRRRARWAAQ